MALQVPNPAKIESVEVVNDSGAPIPVAGTSMVPGTGAMNLGKAEDAPHANGDVGVMALGVLQVSPTLLSGAVGDYHPFEVSGSGRVFGSNEQESSSIAAGGAATTPKFAVIDHAGSGDNTIVAAVADKKIRVLAAHLTMTGTAVTIRFESGAGGTALTGQMTPTQGNSITLPFNPLGWFETGVNALLNLELGGAQSVDGCLVYIEV